MRFETKRGEKRRHSQSYDEHFHRVPPLALAVEQRSAGLNFVKSSRQF